MKTFRPHRRLPRRVSSLRRACCLAALAGLTSLGFVTGLTSTSEASTLFFPRAIAEETNALYDHNCFWGGPRGMDYAALPEPQPIQIPNLYPDKGSTYFPAQLEMPEGSSLTIHGVYPLERYFSFTVANQLGNGSVGNGDFLRDTQIEPDPGSVNPFQTSPVDDRTPTGQTYTLRIVRGSIPEDPAANTLYTTSTAATAPIRLAMRNYIPDQGIGGTGGVELPTVTLTLASGETVTELEAVCKAVKANKEATVTGFPAATYEKQVAKSSEPQNAPAKSTPVFERFWNNNYSILGAFTENYKTRVEKYPATDEGGFATNPDTQFIVAGLSLNFGDVVVVHGKLPTYQQTRPNATKWSSINPQVRYWSICTAQGPVSGKGADCAYDQQVPLDQNGDYTIVISKSGQRPANASTVCGVKWLDFGTGEGEIEGSAPPNRSWEGVVYMRYMDALSGAEWPQSPKNIPEPTPSSPNDELADVMGEYAPAATYTNQAQYEAQGCSAGAPSLASGSATPNTGSFTLEWNAVPNALPQLYTLQRKHVGGGWEAVASGLKSPAYTFLAGSPEDEGTWSYRVGAIDEGSSETEPGEGDFGPGSAPVKVDRSAPPAPTAHVEREPDYAGGGGWYGGSVAVTFSANGAGSLPDGSEAAALEPASLTGAQTVGADGSHEVCGTIENVLGEQSAPACVTVQVDATPPSVSITCPAMVAIGSSAAATVAAADPYSGLRVDPSGTVAIDTNTAGTKTITRTAVSNVGDETTQSCTTLVGYYVVVSGPVNGNLTVRSGEAVELTSKARVEGNVTVKPGGALDVEGGAIAKSLRARGAALLRVCAAAIGGKISIAGGVGPVVIGEGDSGCASSAVTGAAAIRGNAEDVTVEGNTFVSNLRVTTNSGGVTVTDNTIGGSLTVNENAGVVVDRPNPVHGKTKLQQAKQAQRKPHGAAVASTLAALIPPLRT
ncbi:MAG TPA: polymer-forming cytoskeletal protein [Solirubrobacteraceae bacterium]|jgi:hypothetical protein|nr:polymer-forming cytoskeletal protein [Solirubrobacteraceae bacterium]